MESAEDRPNIRIEIKNNLMDQMEIDNEEKLSDSDFEDGEISDKNEQPEEANPSNNLWSNVEEDFSKDQDKLLERANRFGLKSAEMMNLTEDDQEQLLVTLGINEDNKKDIRFEAVHMKGTGDMSTEDVFEYYGKYEPVSIEWISDDSCNVVWRDEFSSIRALQHLSKAIKGLPVEGAFLKETVKVPENDGNSDGDGGSKSILLKNTNRLVQFEGDSQGMEDSVIKVSDITIPIPSGVWRWGLDHPKSKGVFLRLALKSDKKPLRAERSSDYYKKNGNPNFDGVKGLISESRRLKFKSIFDHNKDFIDTDKVIGGENKNPWGDLAEHWDLDERYSEKIYEPQNVVINNDTNAVAGKTDIKNRLGAKRLHETDGGNELSGSGQENVSKKSKVPRMRMYADEEEDKLKRQKQLLAIKLYQTEKVAEEASDVRDLRSIIVGAPKKPAVQEPQILIQVDTTDLATKLKNRKRSYNEPSRRLTAEAEVRQENIPESSSRELKLKPSRPSTMVAKHSKQHQKLLIPKRSMRGDYEERSRYRTRVHSRHERKKSRSFSDDERFDRHKPKSKVAVVIKTQKRPTVASTVWSRITMKKERLKTASERLQSRKESSSSSGSSSNSSDSSDSSSSESSSDSEQEAVVPAASSSLLAVNAIERPGFTVNPQSAVDVTKRKSPLRIEISNDHFKEE